MNNHIQSSHEIQSWKSGVLSIDPDSRILRILEYDIQFDYIDIEDHYYMFILNERSNREIKAANFQ